MKTFLYAPTLHELIDAFVIADSELEDLETQPIHRPHSLKALCKTTKFTEKELKRIYRCFKSECPTGIIKEDAFKNIYSQFFPQGGKFYVIKFCPRFYVVNKMKKLAGELNFTLRM